MLTLRRLFQFIITLVTASASNHLQAAACNKAYGDHPLRDTGLSFCLRPGDGDPRHVRTFSSKVLSKEKGWIIFDHFDDADNSCKNFPVPRTTVDKGFSINVTPSFVLEIRDTQGKITVQQQLIPDDPNSDMHFFYKTQKSLDGFDYFVLFADVNHGVFRPNDTVDCTEPDKYYYIEIFPQRQSNPPSDLELCLSKRPDELVPGNKKQLLNFTRFNLPLTDFCAQSGGKAEAGSGGGGENDIPPPPPAQPPKAKATRRH